MLAQCEAEKSSDLLFDEAIFGFAESRKLSASAATGCFRLCSVIVRQYLSECVVFRLRL